MRYFYRIPTDVEHGPVRNVRHSGPQRDLRHCLAGAGIANPLWLDAIADQIASISRSATGGVLVLLSAYDRQKELLKRLSALGLDDRLVIQGRSGVPVSSRMFKAMAKKGERPIWLAVGTPAWMGLDLNDKEIPNLLSDLVVPRLPFGIAQGITSRWRAKTGGGISMGCPPFVAEAAFAFRQGIGRLVRHSKAKDKRLWVLDSRPWMQASSTVKKKHIYAMFRSILDGYRSKNMVA